MTRHEGINFPPSPESPKIDALVVPELTLAEVESINARANIRRRQFDLRKSLADLGDISKDERYTVIIQNVYQEMGGETKIEGSTDDFALQATVLRQKAKRAEGLDLRHAAYLYAQAAKLELACGKDAKEDMAKADRCIEATKDFVKNNPSHLLPQAILLGIEKRSLVDLSALSKEKIATASQNNEGLLRQYSLILPEEERENFLALMPAEQRKRASIILDHTVSEFLPEQFTQTDLEQAQRTAILERSANAAEQLLSESGENTGDNVVLTVQTLIRLRGEDGLRRLSEVGSTGLVKALNPEQQIRRYEYTAQVINEFLLADAAKGGALAMKFLGRKDLPPRLFKTFFEKLLEARVLTEKARLFFNDEKNWSFLKKLIAQYPNQFNTVIDTLSQIHDYNPAEHEAEVFQALNDLDSITPIIFERYRRTDAKGKKELAKKIKELKPGFFRNQPIRDVLPREDREILAEMVYLAYRPVGMSFGDVQKFIEKLDDRTEDIEKFNFPENGYDFIMEGGRKFALKPGERLDREKLQSYRELFIGKVPQSEEEALEVSKLLERVVKAGSDFETKDLSILLSVMGADQPVRNFLERSKNLTQENYYTYLNELKELLGVYFSDNYQERLENFLSANPKAEGRILKILSSPDRQAVLRKKLAKDGEDINWGIVTTREEAAKAMAVFIQTKVLKLIREEIARMANKFVGSETGEETQQDGKRKLRAYISKNVGSFFAKASAGICTAQDIPLFEREDHFHINIVENEQTVQGNIQAYIISDPDGGRSLVLRGFNPNTAFLDKIDAGAFCEAVLKVARQFQKDNNLAHVYITESLAGWHALSNREAVAQYLQKRYVKEKKERRFTLQIASSTSVGRIYEV